MSILTTWYSITCSLLMGARANFSHLQTKMQASRKCINSSSALIDSLRSAVKRCIMVNIAQKNVKKLVNGKNMKYRLLFSRYSGYKSAEAASQLHDAKNQPHRSGTSNAARWSRGLPVGAGHTASCRRTKKQFRNCCTSTYTCTPGKKSKIDHVNNRVYASMRIHARRAGAGLRQKPSDTR